MRILLLSLLGAALVLAQSNRTACEAAGSAAEALRALRSMSDLSLSWEERMAPRRTLAKKEPVDWPLQIVLQEPILRFFHLGQEWDEAIAQYRRLPDRTLGELLEARLISGLHRKRSREMLDRVLNVAPDSPWAHLAMLEWAAHPVRRDAALAATHFEELRRLCPQNTRAFAFLDSVTDAEGLFRHVQALRQLIESRKKTGLSAGDLVLFRPAWTWERVIAGERGVDSFAQTVRSDLTAIRNLSLHNTPEWYSVLRLGYEQTLKDTAALKSLQQEILQKAPRSQAAWWIEEDRERGDARAPGTESREEMQRRRDRSLAAIRERLTRFGDQPFVNFGIHRLIFDPSSGVNEQEFLRLADLILRLAQRYPDQGASWPPIQILIAEQYAKRKLRLDRVSSLVEEGLRQIEYQEKYRRESDAMVHSEGPSNNVGLAQSRAREILIRHAIATDQPERARAMLADYRRLLETTKPADNASAAARSWGRDHYGYMELVKLAGVDALPVAELMPPKPETSARFPVKDFEVKDLGGRTWRLSDLKGKVAYVNVWITWCGPCRQEMPGIQKLHDRWKDRQDRVVLTISADPHADIARNFVNEQKYTFPVVHGREMVEKFFPPAYFPQNWLIDPAGRRLDIPAPNAYETTLDQIEQLAAKIAAQP